MTVSCRSDIGNHHHVNQDSGGAWAVERPDGIPAALLVVADGVSAGRHSEEASALTVSLLRERTLPVLSRPDADIRECRDVLVGAVRQANHEIAQRPHSAVTSADSTTVAAAVLLGATVTGAWVGDSRVYRVTANRVTRLTVDHSWAEGVVSQGLMTAEQAAQDPRAHVIMRWLGPPEERDPGVETFDTDLDAGDVLLCCTDGLYMYFAPPEGSEDEIARVLSRAPELESGLDELVRLALRRGGYDNVTIAGLKIGGLPRGTITDEVPIVRAD